MKTKLFSGEPLIIEERFQSNLLFCKKKANSQSGLIKAC
jgi:hypothetical protein